MFGRYANKLPMPPVIGVIGKINIRAVSVIKLKHNVLQITYESSDDAKSDHNMLSKKLDYLKKHEKYTQIRTDMPDPDILGIGLIEEHKELK